MAKPDPRDDGTETIRRALTVDRVCILNTTKKKEALLSLTSVLAQSREVKSGDDLEEAIFRREELMSTGIGLGIAVPHVRLPSVASLVMAAGLSREGIADYQSLDDKPVHLVFMVAARADQHAEYLRILSTLSMRLKEPDLKDRLLAATDAAAFYRELVPEA